MLFPYTNVRQNEAINSICNALNRNLHPYPITKPPFEYIRKLLELILGRNCFQFGDNYYLHTIGCAMESTASPEICDITLHDLKQQILQQADHILTWWRYRDNILVIMIVLLTISRIWSILWIKCTLPSNLRLRHLILQSTTWPHNI